MEDDVEDAKEEFCDTADAFRCRGKVDTLEDLDVLRDDGFVPDIGPSSWSGLATEFFVVFLTPPISVVQYNSVQLGP